MRTRFIFVFLTAVALTQANALQDDFWGVEICQGFPGGQYIDFETITWDKRPVSGTSVHATFKAKILKSFYSPYAHLDVRFGPIKFYEGKVPIEHTGRAGEPISFTETVASKYFPAGRFTTVIRIFDQNGNIIECYDAWIKIAKANN